MVDILVVFAFLAMVITPCIVAMENGVTDGAELGVRDEAEPRHESSRVIPG